MDLTSGAQWFAIPIQIFVVDLLLGADNALVIALACRSLDPKDARTAIALGTSGAIFLRLVLTIVANSLLALPLVKIVGAWVLVVIALNVLADHREDVGRGTGSPAPRAGLWSAVAAIVVADATMSLDNVVALAAIARGNFWLLAAGVALSIPVLAYGGLILSAALRSAPWLVTIGAALLGWIAGDMAVSDPLIGDWVSLNAPGLAAIAPALGAAFVFFSGPLSPPPAAPAADAPLQPAASAIPFHPAAAPPVRPSAPSLRVIVREPPEPEGRSEPSRTPMRREDRIAVIGVLVLAVIAGLVLMLVSYLDSLS